MRHATNQTNGHEDHSQCHDKSELIVYALLKELRIGVEVKERIVEDVILQPKFFQAL